MKHANHENNENSPKTSYIVSYRVRLYAVIRHSAIIRHGAAVIWHINVQSIAHCAFTANGNNPCLKYEDYDPYRTKRAVCGSRCREEVVGGTAVSFRQPEAVA